MHTIIMYAKQNFESRNILGGKNTCDARVALSSNESTEENSGGQPPHIYKIVP